MAIKNFAGFESGSAVQGIELHAVASATVVSTGQRTGSYALRSQSTGSDTQYGAIGGFDSIGLPVANVSLGATVYYGFAFKYATKPIGGGSTEPIAGIYNSSGGLKAEVRLSTSGVLSLWDSGLASALGTGATVLSSNTWYYVEVYCGTGASGVSYEVRVNGTSQFTGSNANTTTTNHGSIRLGKHQNRNSEAVDFYYDDVYIDDAAFQGDLYVKICKPNGAGSSAGWTNGTGTTYAEVDEVPHDTDTTYIQAAATEDSLYSTFAVEDTSTVGVAGTVKSVKGHTIGRTTSTTGTSTVYHRVRSGTTNADINLGELTTSYRSFMSVHNTDPATSAAWTLSGVDGVEVGMAAGTIAQTQRFTAAYIYVLYDPSLTVNKSETATVTDTPTVTRVETALTQAEAGLYEDGTESGSSVIDSGADSITRNLSSGDSNLQLRVRLQETNAAAGNTTDDYQLQVSKNSGSWNHVGQNEYVLLDQYSESNRSTQVAFFAGSTTTQEVGQAINVVSCIAEKATFNLRKTGSPTGNVVCNIYAATGTVGSSATPTGSALATSDAVDASTISTSFTLVEFTFSGANRINMSGDYVIAVTHSTGTGDVSNRIDIGYDNTSSSHAGNYTSKFNGVWSASSSNDAVFYFYATKLPITEVVGYNSASLTDGNATTNRLGSGTGSFVAGEISEDGLVDDLQITASNYTELLYSLTIDSDSVADADTLDFRVLRNGATTGMTYTVTPRITVSKGTGDPTINKSESVSVTESRTVLITELHINKSETTTVTENVLRETINRIDVSDTTTVAESVQSEAVNRISVSDSSNVTESVQREATNFINKTDSTALTDTPTVNDRAPWYNTDTLTITTGSITSGTIKNTWTDNASRLVLAETVGSPAFDYSFTFYDVLSTVASVKINGFYDGGPTHEVKLYQWNFTGTSWTALTSDATDLPSAASDQDYVFKIFAGADYLQSGELRIRIAHLSPGAPVHTLNIDQLELQLTKAAHLDETTTLSESLKLETNNFINKSESTTVTDTPTVSILERVVSVSDTTTVSEVLQREVIGRIAVSDTTTVSESVQALIEFYVISKSDTAAVAESVQREVINRISVTDTSTVSESVTVYVPEYHVAISDSTTVTDTPAVAIDTPITERNVSVSDSTTVSEALQQRVDSFIYNNGELVDQQSLNWPYISYFGAVEDQERVAQSFVTFRSEPLARIGVILGVSINTSITDAAQMKIYADNGSNEPGDLLATSLNTVNGTLLASRSNVITSFMFDGPMLEAGQTYWFVLNRTGSLDNFNYYTFARDTWSEAYEYGTQIRYDGEFVGWVDDNADMYFEQYSAPSDTVTVTDTPTVSIESATATTINVSDSVSVAEALQLHTDNRVQVSDTSTVTDTPTVSIDNYVINRTDSVAVTESVQRLVENRIQVSDTSSISESVQRHTENRIAVSDTSTVTESVQRETINRIVVAATSTVTENAQVSIDNYVISKSDTTTITESVTIVRVDAGALAVSVSESVTLAETVQLSIETTISKSDTATVTEALNFASVGSIAVSDSIAVNEVIIVSSTGDVYLDIYDTASVTESAAVAIRVEISVTDTTTVTELVALETAYSIAVSDSTTVSESTKLAIAIDLAASDTTTIGEAVALLAEISIITTSTITVTDVLQPFDVNTSGGVWIPNPADTGSYTGASGAAAGTWGAGNGSTSGTHTPASESSVVWVPGDDDIPIAW